MIASQDVTPAILATLGQDPKQEVRNLIDVSAMMQKRSSCDRMHADCAVTVLTLIVLAGVLQRVQPCLGLGTCLVCNSEARCVLRMPWCCLAWTRV